MGHKPVISFYNKVRLNGHCELTLFATLGIGTNSSPLNFVKRCRLGRCEIRGEMFDIVSSHLCFLVH
jgi:hypothetical protein